MVYDNEEELKKVIGCSDSEKGYINHGVAAEKWNERGRKEILVNFLEDSQLEGKLQEAVINLASEMAKICKS